MEFRITNSKALALAEDPRVYKDSFNWAMDRLEEIREDGICTDDLIGITLLPEDTKGNTLWFFKIMATLEESQDLMIGIREAWEGQDGYWSEYYNPKVGVTTLTLKIQ